MNHRIHVCEAAYLFAERFNEGQVLKTYGIFGRLSTIGYYPNQSLTIDNASKETKDIYYELIKRYYPAIWKKQFDGGNES